MTLTESQAREEICRVGRSLFERGYVHATAGNISVRLDDGFLITPTDACLGFLQADKLAKLDLQGQQISGDKASKTLSLHRHIYEAAAEHDPDTRCVIHTHSTHCVALSLQAHGPELLPPITPYFVMKVGHVPLLRYHRPGSPDAAKEVAALIRQHTAQGTPIRAVMLPRLGPNVWHDSPQAAMATLEELEETARLMLLQPGTLPLKASDLDELRQTFGARW
ncbi:MAG: Methylthioribulose-phosphate dehydratase [Pseudomonadota bacterium]|jgi:ribulose-5-phosphate 4-epimerase/fuculose-1-phosphate aldolase